MYASHAPNTGLVIPGRLWRHNAARNVWIWQGKALQHPALNPALKRLARRGDNGQSGSAQQTWHSQDMGPFLINRTDVEAFVFSQGIEMGRVDGRYQVEETQ